MGKQIKTRKKRGPNVKKVQVVQEVKVEEEINLDEIFKFDEVNLDEVLLGVNDDLGINKPEKIKFENRKSDADKIIEAANADAETEEAMKFYKGIFLEYPQIPDNFETFSLKFRYFLLIENLDYHHLTLKKVQKFIKNCLYYDVNEIKKVLLIVNL